MEAQRPFARKRVLLWLAALPCMLASANAVYAGGDRIFADGFDPCCRIGGTVSGLAGSGLVLHLDAGAISEDRPVSSNGLYAFGASVAPGTAFSVSINSQPGGQSCSVANATGTMGSSAVDNANVTCGDGLRWDHGQWGEPWQ